MLSTRQVVVRFLILFTAGLLSGCHQGVILDGTVTISAEVQESVSFEQPGVLYLSIDIPKTPSTTYRLGVLCLPMEDDVTWGIEHDGYGCAKEGTIEAWVEQVDEQGDLVCGFEQVEVHGETPADVSQAVLLGLDKTTVFRGDTERSGCVSGEARVDLRVEALE
jgi:hypothetical protein